MKKQIFFTISLVLLGMIIALVALSYKVQQEQLQSYMDRKFTLVSRYYDGIAEHETYEMGSTIDAIMHNSEIKGALKKGDRELLLKLSGPLYKQLQERDVTHFYFTGPDRTNILRVHNPGRFGDTINRQTTLDAEITGKETSGMELGPFGTFTLRVVSPWFDGEDLIGYVELGKEVEHAVGELRGFLDIKAYAFIHKKYVVRGGWEEGLELLGRKAEWDRFIGSVNIGKALDDLPPMLIKFLSDEQFVKDAASIDVRVGARTYRTGYLPLLDVNNKEVGHISVMVDMTDAVSTFYRYILMVVVISMFAVITILIASSFILSRFEKE